MRTLILAAGRFGSVMKRDIADGREPRLDVFQIADVLNADVIDYQDLDRSMLAKRLVGRGSARSAGVAWLGFREHRRYDAVLTTGEDIGLPFAALMKSSAARSSHTMIAHTLFPFKKQVFFSYLGVASRIDRVLAYSTSEERHMIERLGLPEHKVQRIFYHADENFFRPDARVPEPDLICAAGQLLRDYDCLIEAVRDLPVRVQIAAGSPWIDHKLEPSRELPKNVTWGKLGRYDLRELYARSAVAVVPIFENDYQTGIATILEMMAMGKCVVATRTRGQTDTIVDGVTGVYVPPSDPQALKATLSRLLAAPDEARRIGQAARRFVEEKAGLDLFVQRVVEALRAGHEQRQGGSRMGADSVSGHRAPPMS